MRKNKLSKALSVVFLLASASTWAVSYNLPPENKALIGSIKYETTKLGENVSSVAKQYDLGYNALVLANPQLDTKRGFPANAPLQIPNEHLLPNQPREGIVINLPEMRMYYYVGNKVLTYPIGIGKIGKTIPITQTAITRKVKDPVWVPPDDIREFNLQQGIVLPKVMPAGPDNPLGPYAIYMKVPTYLIHSTIFPESIGTRASFGCIRMYESDIKTFFPTIKGGIPVAIVNSPVKFGWQDNRLFMEAYPPLEEHSKAMDAQLPGMVHNINVAAKEQDESVLIDWQGMAYIAEQRDGIPHEIGIKLPS